MSPSDWQILIVDSSPLVAPDLLARVGIIRRVLADDANGSVEVWEPLSERPLRGVKPGTEIAAGDGGSHFPVPFSMEPQ